MVPSQALRMLETALDIEARGRRFYAQALDACKNPFGRAVFQKLLDDEAVHTSRIQNLWKGLQAGADWPSEPEGQTHEGDGLDAFFRELIAQTGDRIRADTNDLRALDIGIEFETQAVLFYEAAEREATDGLQARFLRRMLAEERGHASALTELRQYLVDPEAWFKKHENLDG